MNRIVLVVLMLTPLVIAFGNADARPEKGDKTIGLSATNFYFESGTEEGCDKDGDNCTETDDFTRNRFGVGGSGGYLFTEMVEAGASIGVAHHSSEHDYGSGDKRDLKTLDLSVGLYGKLHFGSDTKMVPFV